MPHLVPEGSLDDQQREHLREIRENPNQSYWISGFPGSGKTVLLYYFLRDSHKEGKNVAFATFTHTLLRLFNSITEELGVGGVYHNTVYHYLNRKKSSDVLVCDEVQDFSEKMVHGIKLYANRLLVSGDGNQSIYKRDPFFESQVLPVQNTKELLNVKTLNLAINHRLPTSVLQGINVCMQNNKIWGGADGTKIGNLLYYRGDSFSEEVSFVVNDATEKCQQAGKTVAMLFSTKKDMFAFIQTELNNKGFERKDSPHRIPSFNSYLKECGIPIMIVANRDGSLAEAERDKKIVMMTMHGSKGLDFDSVFIPSFRSNYEIYSLHPDLQDTLLMVAMSRTKNDLIFSYYGSPHPKLQLLIDSGKCQQIQTSKPSASSDDIIIDF